MAATTDTPLLIFPKGRVLSVQGRGTRPFVFVKKENRQAGASILARTTPARRLICNSLTVPRLSAVAKFHLFSPGKAIAMIETKVVFHDLLLQHLCIRLFADAQDFSRFADTMRETISLIPVADADRQPLFQELTALAEIVQLSLSDPGPAPDAQP
ncbi:MAG: hypothetical protein U0Z53_23820 [Blastocatellia bacterium]